MYAPDEIEYAQTASGVAVPASEEDLERDEVGFTHPNLHRRIEPTFHGFAASEPGSPVEFEPYDDKPQFEFKPRDYKFLVSGLNSYRLTEIYNHDEESTFWEVP